MEDEERKKKKWENSRRAWWGVKFNFKVFLVIQKLLAENRSSKYLTFSFQNNPKTLSSCTIFLLFCQHYTSLSSCFLPMLLLSQINQGTSPCDDYFATETGSDPFKSIQSPFILIGGRLVKLLSCGLALGGIWLTFLKELPFWYKFLRSTKAECQ